MLRRALPVSFLFAVLGCLSPTLPLPPPGRPTLEPTSDVDHIRLDAASGSAESNAVIVIVNSNTLVPNDQAVTGSRADALGAWHAVVFAHTGDVLNITQEFGTARSPPTVVQVP
ncbi:MAG TPA: hypothetical protein VGY54_26210 [Polyangiaceae bacterium]|jgi:hypothetical protein|nr:hypothetical protein [Polyangiaceae bacterium]